MNCRHGYFFGYYFSSFWTPRDAIFWCFEADVVQKKLHKHETKKGTGRLGWGAWKSTKSFQLLNFLCPTLHVQLPCETLVLLPAWGALEERKSCYHHDGGWGGVKRRRFGARIESLGVDFFGDRIPEGREWLQEMMGEHVLFFGGWWTFLYPLVLCFGACFTVSPSKRRSLAVIVSGFRL